jgi:hypothetical protein
MKLTIEFTFLLLVFISCSNRTNEIKQQDSTNKTKTENWITHQDTVDVGFIMTFQYPDNLTFADVIDNCRCVGEKIENENKNQGTDSTNTRQWSICMQDTADYSVEYLIKSWKSIYKGKIEEFRDSVTIENLKALRVTLESNNKNDPYRQLIYFKKYSTLFEIINIYKETNEDFEIFYSSLRIDEFKKPSH